MASWQPLEALASCLHALRAAARGIGVEVIIVRPVRSAADEEDFRRVVEGFPETRAVSAPAGATVPDLRAIGARMASAPVVALIEDHCRPVPGWCEAAATLGARWGAAGGPITNLSRDSLTNRAAYFADYGEYAPLPDGQALRLQWPSGANVAYRREALLRALDEFSGSSPWEGPLHAALEREGMRPVVATALELGQERRVRVRDVLLERFAHGRSYATERLSRATRARRAGRALLAPLVPPLLMTRAGRRAWQAGSPTRADFIAALPVTLLLLSAWALGELTACVRPPTPHPSTAGVSSR